MRPDDDNPRRPEPNSSNAAFAFGDGRPAGSHDDTVATEDPRLFAAVQEYVQAVEAGRKPNRRELLERHPDIRDELSACLQGLAFVNSAVARIDETNAGMVGQPDAHTADDVATGRPLGDFRLIRELGRGGMGIIYEAEQLSLGRRVALKVLPLASALDPRHLQRFRNEAQAAAHLHHTNIVPVYAVGCERSVHFYAMQLIEGQSLAEVIRSLRAKGEATAVVPGSLGAAPPVLAAFLRRSADASGKSSTPEASRTAPAVAPSDSLDQLSALRAVSRSAFFRAVARLGKQAAEALEYAHQQGVVHRDIKPANLMLDVRGTLWITDFGLAQMYADTGLTQPGDVLGTLRYMSPEQASGRAVVLDQRTDVYSLGATLYEFLTLRSAFGGDNRAALLGDIAQSDPPSPRSLDKSVPPELETIVLKAMGKSPADRYQTAGEMAADFSRYLQDEPIRARPPTLRDKAVKWARRHRPLVNAAIAVLLLAVGGLVVTTFLVTREQARTAIAYQGERRRAAEAQEERARAEASRREAHRIVGAFTQFAASDTPKNPRFMRLRHRMLQDALSYTRGFIDARQNEPAAAAEVADAREWLRIATEELSLIDEISRVEYASALLQEPDVQNELQLSQQQVTAIDKLNYDFLSSPPPGSPTSQSESLQSPSTTPSALTENQRRNTLLLHVLAHGEAVEGEMSPEQARRLRQLSRQGRGPFAFTDADVAAALSLTPAQLDLVRHEEATLVDLDHHGPRGLPQEVAAVQNRAAVARIVASLSLSQREAWTALTGPAYAGDLLPDSASAPGVFRGRRGGGPGGGHGPRDGAGLQGGPPPFDHDGPERFK
jgi:serine/threonine protein kinase